MYESFLIWKPTEKARQYFTLLETNIFTESGKYAGFHGDSYGIRIFMWFFSQRIFMVVFPDFMGTGSLWSFLHKCCCCLLLRLSHFEAVEVVVLGFGWTDLI